MRAFYNSLLICCLIMVVGCSRNNSSEQISNPSPTAPVAIVQAPRDSDNDGVYDAEDACPVTPNGEQVDSMGCTIFVESAPEYYEPEPEAVVSADFPCVFDLSRSSCLVDLPLLEWPLPTPSASKLFTQQELSALDTSTFGSLTTQIENILRSQDYQRFSYYNIPTGIAMAAQLERIESNGTPFPSPDRWKFGDLSLSTENFSFLSILKKFVGADVGNYRVLVFLLTSKDMQVSFPNQPQSTEQIRNMARNGALNLPTKLSNLPFGERNNLTLALYEIELKRVGVDPELITSGLQVQDHLVNTNINLAGGH